MTYVSPNGTHVSASEADGGHLRVSMAAGGSTAEFDIARSPLTSFGYPFSWEAEVTQLGVARRWRIGASTKDEVVAAMLGGFEHRELASPFAGKRITDRRFPASDGYWQIKSFLTRPGGRSGYEATARLIHAGQARSPYDLKIEMVRGGERALLELFLGGGSLREDWLNINIAGRPRTTFEELVAMAVRVVDKRAVDARERFRTQRSQMRRVRRDGDSLQ